MADGGRGQDRQSKRRSWRSLALLYAAFIGLKFIYAAIVWATPLFVRWYIRRLEQALMTDLNETFRVGYTWLVLFLILALLTVLLAVRLAVQAVGRSNRPREKRQPVSGAAKLILCWILLDSVCLYGILSKILGYPNLWCYGFVVLSLVLTIGSGWSLVVLRPLSRQ